MVANLVAFPPRLREGAPRKGFVDETQYRLLAANANQLWLRALIACAYSFGFRKGELLNLRVRQVDLLHRWIELEPGTTKNDEARKVKMTSEVFALLSECVRGKSAIDFVFTRADGSRTGDPRKAWYNLCAACGLGTLAPAESKRGYRKYTGLLLHDFRRAAVRNLVRRGVPEVVAMRVNGHKTRAVFDRYNIVDEADLERAAQALEGNGHAAKTYTTTYTAHVRPS